MSPDPPDRPGPDHAAEPVEKTDEFLAGEDKKLEQIDEDIRKAEKKLDWLRREPDV